jgi:hypothetical protein
VENNDFLHHLRVWFLLKRLLLELTKYKLKESFSKLPWTGRIHAKVALCSIEGMSGDVSDRCPLLALENAWKLKRNP